MAGDWIKMTVGLRSHPKVVRMASALKADRLRAIGGLFAVWSVFDQHSVDGVLDGYTLSAMDEEIGWKGFSAAMQGIRWLDSSDAGLTVPEFDEHNGKSAKIRAEDTKRKRKDRTGLGQMSDELPDKYRTDSGPEKRREEINTLAPTGACPVEPDVEPGEAEVFAKPGFPDCPYGELRRLWKKHLPHLTQPRVWDGQRKVSMRNRWRQAATPSEFSPDGYATEAAGIAWWGSFFSYIANDTRLSAGFESNGRTWKPDLEWVCNASNFQKIIDGKYSK